MTNKIYKYGSVAVMALASICMTACSDQFLEDKRAYGSYNKDQVYESYVATQNRIDFLYQSLLPDVKNGGSGNTNITSVGRSDDYSKCTEEYGGTGAFNDQNTVLTSENVTDYFYVKNDVDSPWGRIRECNDVISGIENSTSFTETEKNELLGQALFFRAWRYYLLVKIYGGVPIIDYVQSPVLGENGGLDLIVPRSTTKECVNFICNDLSRAAKCLPARWNDDATNFGRVTAGTALALKGRLLLLYASPLFNRGDELSRWEAAYQANKNALDTLALGGFGLAYAGAPNKQNAKDWARMFCNNSNTQALSEAVFVTMYNNVDLVDHQAPEKFNPWEQNIRPSNANGGGGLEVTSDMVDLFPMVDGSRPNDYSEGTYQYDKELFFLNRDPRFYRTFAFPGVAWQFVGSGLAAISETCPYSSGTEYALWSYCWYDNEDDRNSVTKSGFAADLLGTKNKSLYLRKRSDDAGLGQTALYKFNTVAGNTNGFNQSAAPYMEIRFAEVLLNYAESACGAGHNAEAVEALKQIRQRVGYTGDCGLKSNLSSDRAKLFEAILYERQIELAYEGKRFDDMRRWMLFDGGEVIPSGAPSSWKLTGFDGNTCKYLGVQKMNERGKRFRIEVYVKDILAKKENGADPFIASYEAKEDGDERTMRPDALSLNEDIISSIDDNTIITDAKVKGLVEFYRKYLQRKDLSVDGNDVSVVPTFDAKYYFLGFKRSAQQMNSTLLQTVCWEDIVRGGTGTFDPLAE